MFIFIAILKSIGSVVLLTFVPFFITMFSYAWLKKKKISAVTSGEQTAIAYSLLLLAFLVSLPQGLELANYFIKDYLADSHSASYLSKVFYGFFTLLLTLFCLTTLGIMQTGVLILSWLFVW